MAVEVPQNEEISGGEKNGGRKGVDSAIRRRANKGAYTLKNGSEEELIREMESSEKDRPCLTKSDDAVASVRGTTKENTRPGVGVIRTQSRESKNPERGR